MMIPFEFRTDGPNNRWWIMGQWHVQPDRTKLETWDDYPDSQPSISLDFAYLNGHYYLNPVYMAIPPTIDNVIEIQPDQWLKIKVDITWSQGEDGKMSLWINDNKSPHIIYNGPNMLNAYQHYFKVGMYRHPKIKTENTINLKQLHISKTNN